MKNIRAKDLKCENSFEKLQDEINLCWLEHEYFEAVEDRCYWGTVISQVDKCNKKIKRLQLEQKRLEKLVTEIRHIQAELDGIDSVEPYEVERMTKMPYDALLEIFKDVNVIADTNFWYTDYVADEIHEELRNKSLGYLDKYVKNNKRGKYKR